MTTQKFITIDIRELTYCTDKNIQNEDVLFDFHNSNYEGLVREAYRKNDNLDAAANYLLNQLHNRGYTITAKGTEFTFENILWAIEEYIYFKGAEISPCGTYR
tara:strand:+ start:209 stop:517 length:309 start_codon:yes stop_codon:yes gene_type:complete